MTEGAYKALFDRQERFTYFLMSLNAAAVAYSISSNFNVELSGRHVFLGVAIFLWMSSMFAAFHFLLANIGATIDQISKEQNLSFDNDKAIKNLERGQWMFILHYILFLLGVILYITYWIANLSSR